MEQSKMTDSTFSEYQLAIETQMHFNEILMKFRSFGIAAIIAIFSFAISRNDVVQPVIGTLTQAEIIGLAGILFTLLIGVTDLFYFFPLLLGAVDRSITIEETNKSLNLGLTTSISNRIPEPRAKVLISLFYIALIVFGFLLVGPIL